MVGHSASMCWDLSNRRKRDVHKPPTENYKNNMDSTILSFFDSSSSSNTRFYVTSI